MARAAVDVRRGGFFMENKFVTGLKKFCFYAAGLLFIAVGINFSRLSKLGISPVSSVPGSCNILFGWSLGAWTIVVYCLLIVLQIIVLRKQFKPINLLGIPIAVAFGLMVDFFGVGSGPINFFGLEIGFGNWLGFLPKPEVYPARLGYFAASLVLIAVGVFLYLRPKWPAMPAEGLAGAISQVSGMKFGNCKSIVDTSMIVVSFSMHFIYSMIKGVNALDYVKAFAGIGDTEIVVGIGTLISAVVIGQLVKLLTKLMGQKVDGWIFKK